MPVLVATTDTPLGAVTVAAHGGSLVAMSFADHFERVATPVRRRLAVEEWVRHDDPVGAVTGLARYFAGDVRALDDIPVDPTGTDFRRKVWEALRRIRPGETWSYAQLAAAVGSPSASRAVGSANGANPLWLIVPCHRVISADGRLGGYGGGLERKAWLLDHEGAAFRR